MKRFSLAAIIAAMSTIVNFMGNLSYDALLKYAIFLVLTGSFIIIVWKNTRK